MLTAMSPAKLLRRRPRWLIGLLVLTLLGPGLVPVQGHTRLVTTLDGQLHTLCTWQGPAHQDSPEPWQSPAYSYALLLGGAVSSAPAPLVSGTEFHPVYQPAIEAGSPGLVPRTEYAIRAPPAILC